MLVGDVPAHNLSGEEIHESGEVQKLAFEGQVCARLSSLLFLHLAFRLYGLMPYNYMHLLTRFLPIPSATEILRYP